MKFHTVRSYQGSTCFHLGYIVLLQLIRRLFNPDNVSIIKAKFFFLFANVLNAFRFLWRSNISAYFCNTGRFMCHLFLFEFGFSVSPVSLWFTCWNVLLYYIVLYFYALSVPVFIFTVFLSHNIVSLAVFWTWSYKWDVWLAI